MEPNPLPVTNSLIVQHNALVNAQFNMSGMESRIFLSMLAHISRNDTEFQTCRIEIREILEMNSQNYALVRKSIDTFGGCKLRIETLGSPVRRQPNRTFTVIPLVEFAEYKEGEGYVSVQFNNRLMPYLLELRDNFTKAQLSELLKIKGPNSFRIYWLLREYVGFGKRTIPLAELKRILNVTQEYDRFNNFRVRILDQAQKELAETDAAFRYNTVKRGRDVIAIEFIMGSARLLKAEKSAAALKATARVLLDWEQALVTTGVSMSSLPQIHERLSAGDYELGYVHFVLAYVKSQVVSGKVKREGGAVFKALTNSYLLPSYVKAQAQAKPFALQPTGKPTAANLRLRKKLSGELEDARNSLRFVETAPVYSSETRPAALREAQTRITVLEAQYQQLG